MSVRKIVVGKARECELCGIWMLRYSDAWREGLETWCARCEDERLLSLPERSEAP